MLIYLQQFTLHVTKLCAQFIRPYEAREESCQLKLEVASCKSCMRQVADNAQGLKLVGGGGDPPLLL